LAKAITSGLHAHAAHLDLLPLLEDVGHGADASLDELGDVNQAIDAFLELDERAWGGVGLG
jgi:hypothetical protein